jgi:hypothetical protein
MCMAAKQRNRLNQTHIRNYTQNSECSNAVLSDDHD